VKPIMRADFQAGKLIKDYPPRWHHQNKRVVFEIARSSGAPFGGHIVFARWAEEQPPKVVAARNVFSVRPGVFDYAASKEPKVVTWHMNFADPHLFVAYDSSLLAQDELQVAEHPILGSLRDALISSGKPPKTIDERGRPTPITISGVQRRCAIDTLPNPEEGRPSGLYGNSFARASEEQVKSATKPLIPPTITNILAVTAPSFGAGLYTKGQITYVLNAALTGFSAAHRESMRIAGTGSRTIINTGFWGCGVFGGNRTLMTILQALAGDLAEVDIVFWAFDQMGVQIAEDAYKLYMRLRNSTVSVSEMIEELGKQKFQWGVSDGN